MTWGSHWALRLLRGTVVRGLLTILGLKKLKQYIFIFGNEKKKPMALSCKLWGADWIKNPWLVGIAEHALTANNDSHVWLQRACDNSLKRLFLPLLPYKCLKPRVETVRGLGQTPEPLLLGNAGSHICNWATRAF